MVITHVNKVQLAETAEQLLELLEKYQGSRPAARNVLERGRALIERARNMEIESPLPKGFFPEEFWESGDLFELEDLGEVVATFNLLLRGAESREKIKQSVEEIERQTEEDDLELKSRLRK